MIRSDAEYQEAIRRLSEEKKRVVEHTARLRATGLSPDEVNRALDPLRSFHLQLQEEVEGYERLKRGDFEDVINFEGLGRMLVAVRIGLGLTQRELAERLGVHESQVSRDERNEYHNVTVERAARVLNVMQAELHSTVQLKHPDTSGSPRIDRGVQIGSTPILTRAASFRPPSESQLMRDGEQIHAVS